MAEVLSPRALNQLNVGYSSISWLQVPTTNWPASCGFSQCKPYPGLDTGAMSGFDNATVDAAFFAQNGWRSNFLVNLGHGDPAGLFNRSPRLPFEEACLLA